MAQREAICIDAEQFRAFLTTLDVATLKYRTSANPEVQREGWSDVIVAISDFLGQLPDADVGPLHILTDLIGDLGDLNEGRRPPRLMPSKWTPKRRTTNVAIADYATAAALIEMLIAGGLSEEQAACRVARVAGAIGAALPKNIKKRGRQSERPDHERLLDWRARLRSAKAKDPKFSVAHQIYKFWRDMYRQHKERYRLSEIDAAEDILKMWPGLKGKKVQ